MSRLVSADLRFPPLGRVDALLGCGFADGARESTRDQQVRAGDWNVVWLDQLEGKALIGAKMGWSIPSVSRRPHVK